MNFYIADMHFGHKNILNLDNRPFNNVEEMEYELVKNWNKKVTDEDTVYILGDFIWSKDVNVSVRIVNLLNGKKVLVIGNHDINIREKRYIKAYELFEFATNYVQIKDGDSEVILCHYPIPCFKRDYINNTYMLYGHVHTTKEDKLIEDFRERIRLNYNGKGENFGHFINVGCMKDYMDYTPRTLEELKMEFALI